MGHFPEQTLPFFFQSWVNYRQFKVTQGPSDVKDPPTGLRSHGVSTKESSSLSDYYFT